MQEKYHLLQEHNQQLKIENAKLKDMYAEQFDKFNAQLLENSNNNLNVNVLLSVMIIIVF
jgi:hypothetical protein